MNLGEFFGEVVYSYSRTQAIEDGVLVDVTEMAREAGWRWPVAITEALRGVIETIPKRHAYQPPEGRLRDVLWMSSRAAKASRGGDRIGFEVILFREGSRKKFVHLIAHVGPGDTPEPVVTIGFASDF